MSNDSTAVAPESADDDTAHDADRRSPADTADTAGADTTGADTAGADTTIGQAQEDRGPSLTKRVGSASVSVRALATGAVVLLLIAAVAVLWWRYADSEGELDRVRTEAAAEERAETTALAYADGAADMNFQDLAAWRAKLVENVSPELSAKLSQAATSMEQIIVPLQWKSTSTPIAAKVRSHDGPVYVVDAFVGVETRNSQAPDGIQSTATYSVTVDESRGFLITDVGGIGALPK